MSRDGSRNRIKDRPSISETDEFARLVTEEMTKALVLLTLRSGVLDPMKALANMLCWLVSTMREFGVPRGVLEETFAVRVAVEYEDPVAVELAAKVEAKYRGEQARIREKEVALSRELALLDLDEKKGGIH